MQARLLQLIARRLQSSSSQLSPLRRFSSASGDAPAESYTFSNRERPLQQCKQPRSSKQNPSENFDSESYLNPNSIPNSNCDPNPHLVLNPRTDDDAKASPDAVQKCIWAVERLSKGKRYTVLDRRQERIPGYVCDQDSAVVRHSLILMDRFQIESLWSLLGKDRFMRTIFTLEVFDGFGSDSILYRQPVLPRRINFDSSDPEKIMNIGFAKAPPGTKLRLDVPIRIYGQENCIGLKKGGFLKVHLSYVSVFCLPEELPPYLEIHVNEMDIGDKICLGDLGIGVPLHSRSEPSLPICEIMSACTI